MENKFKVLKNTPANKLLRAGNSEDKSWEMRNCKFGSFA